MLRRGVPRADACLGRSVGLAGGPHTRPVAVPLATATVFSGSTSTAANGQISAYRWATPECPQAITGPASRVTVTTSFGCGPVTQALSLTVTENGQASPTPVLNPLTATMTSQICVAAIVGPATVTARQVARYTLYASAALAGRDSGFALSSPGTASQGAWATDGACAVEDVDVTFAQAGAASLTASYLPGGTATVSLPVAVAAPPPITINAPAVVFPAGSMSAVDVSPVINVTSIGGLPASASPSLSESLESGSLSVAATTGAAVGAYPLTLVGKGCTVDDCDWDVIVHVTVRIVPLPAPPGAIEAFTEASPDRVAAATNNDLQDELLVTLGTPDAPGTRAQADAAAAAAGGVVSGGLQTSASTRSACRLRRTSPVAGPHSRRRRTSRPELLDRLS